jgi:outer membrane protein assembly factor BamD (BamD/ComL family)
MKLAFLLTFIFLVILFTACSSVDSDARKAAQLNKESIEYVKEGDLEEAERAYKEAQEILSRYKGTEKYDEFQTAYNTYMHGESPNN